MAENQSIEELKARIDTLENEQHALREDVSRAQLDEWEGRLDDVGLQLRLASMDLRDLLDPIVDRARAEIEEAKARIDDGSSTASDAAAAIRSGFQQAWGDLRSAIKDAKNIVTH